MSDTPTILWLRRDLRLADQAAVLAAAEEGPVVPLYVLDDVGPGVRPMGGASRWWLHHSLARLSEALAERGSQLILRRGASADVIAEVAAEVGATRVHALRHYESWWRTAEAAVAERLDLVLHDGNYLAPPGSVTTGGRPYRIYTPFWRALSSRMPPPRPQPAPERVPAPAAWPRSDRLDDWDLLPTRPDWAGGLREMWQPGEAGAAARLDTFRGRVAAYATARNLPSEPGTAAISPHLHFGEISAAQAWHQGGAPESATWASELAWRDFAQNLIVQFPDYARVNGRPRFDALRWREGAEAEADLVAWQRGETGYPIVDAGMRQLWAIGWMHNRVRMITASFLIKHLLVDWRRGEEWFWDCLVCADYGNNSTNWQWVAGTGVDSSMFSRIMAPIGQSEKFAAGNYIRRWVPELAHLSDEVIHDPEAAGVRPASYPPPRIGHREARERALAAYAALPREA